MLGCSESKPWGFPACHCLCGFAGHPAPLRLFSLAKWGGTVTCGWDLMANEAWKLPMVEPDTQQAFDPQSLLERGCARGLWPCPGGRVGP